ncbi:MAG: tetratricopeptide repeat protein [Chloroflexi bacterium]|nr:tetratricopeptide repeat protein [Chloroflexota bacterium]
MAKVSLRIYNREIEGMIDQGRTEEAIAHCHHILKSFPKHLETYRLLGKSYLESKRYNEAVDIFGRVLMSVPDDFVAHVGMSIIRDEENKLDDAIWHMERAFEAKSANAAIQGELQRLYGRRDGMEPPKIRMTRGALAHMYVQGELYPQAIAEIRAVLAQDPQRGDMQVLLALSYFKAGQKADASDMCTQLLKRYPYSFDANRIMVELLPATPGAAENTQAYRTRVGELDPYSTFAKGSVFQSNEVADAAINLDRLDYTGNEVPMGQEWGRSLGIGLGSSSAVPSLSASIPDEQPDWLRSGGFAEPSKQSADSIPVSQSNDEIPDFLRAAGWGESNTPEQPTSIFDQEPVAGGLAPAEMPDWLKGQMPAGSSEPAQSQAPSQSIETPDWLRGLTDSTTAAPFDSFKSEPAQAGETPDWLSGLGGVQAASEPLPSANVPDWLSGLGDNSQTSAPGQSVEAPDWLSGLGGSQQSQTQPEPVQSGNAPDWLRGLEDPAISESMTPGNAPDWLNGLDDRSQTIEPEPAQPAKLPDWLSSLEGNTPSQPAASVQDLGTSAHEQDDAVAWLESLAAKHGAKPEELVTDPNKRSDIPPDWVSQAQNLSLQGGGTSSVTPSVDSLGSSAQEQDDAVAWLESLAAKHGAKPEELVTDPNKRFETPPEWVSQAQTLGQQEPAVQTPAPNADHLGSTAQEQDDAVAWLESLAAKHGAKPEELVTDPSKRFETPPEWVSQAQSIGEAQAASNALETQNQKPEAVENALNIGEQFFAEFEDTSSAGSANDETGMWLRNLEKQELESSPAAKPADLPDWLSGLQAEEAGTVDHQDTPRAGKPSWLNEAPTPTDNVPEQKSAAPGSDLPAWLSGIEDETVSQASLNDQSLSTSDLSNWLSGLDEEPSLPFDALPTPDSILAAKKAQEVSDKTKDKLSSSSLPDWMIDAEDQQASLEDDLWKKSFGQEPIPAASVRTEKPAPANQPADLPDWLQGADAKAPEAQENVEQGEDTPPWQHREKWEAEDVQQPKPTSPSDWHPLTPDMIQKQPAAQFSQQKPVALEKSQPEVEMQVSKKKAAMPVRARQAESMAGDTVLIQAKGELDRGDIPAALDHYGKLIKKGRQLEETIRDLTESLYRYPVEVGIWQTLGDAYMRANRLKEALESYNKAEELIR